VCMFNVQTSVMYRNQQRGLVDYRYFLEENCTASLMTRYDDYNAYDYDWTSESESGYYF
jgi:hypothetical protein